MQKFIWRAQYVDGTSLCEFEGAHENSFYDINRDQLAYFYLEGSFAIKIDIFTGEITVKDKALAMPQLVTHYYRPTIYELIQYKRGIAMLSTKNQQAVHQVIASFNVGWKYTIDNTHAQVILSVDGFSDAITMNLKETDLTSGKSERSVYLLEVE